MRDKYILDDNEQPVEEPDLLKWADWFETANRCLAETTIDGVRVSTVFLGIDHNFARDPDPVPVLWETMIFGGRHDGWQDRYSSADAARVGHERGVAIVKGEIALDARAEAEELFS